MCTVNLIVAMHTEEKMPKGHPPDGLQRLFLGDWFTVLFRFFFLNLVNWSLYSVYPKKKVGFCDHGTINTVMMAGCVLGKGHTEHIGGPGRGPWNYRKSQERVWAICLGGIPSPSSTHFPSCCGLAFPPQMCVSLLPVWLPWTSPMTWTILDPKLQLPIRTSLPHPLLEPCFFQCGHAFVASAQNVLTTCNVRWSLKRWLKCQILRVCFSGRPNWSSLWALGTPPF